MAAVRRSRNWARQFGKLAALVLIAWLLFMLLEKLELIPGLAGDPLSAEVCLGALIIVAVWSLVPFALAFVGSLLSGIIRRRPDAYRSFSFALLGGLVAVSTLLACLLWIGPGRVIVG